jgi:predicted P-loop ATPase
MVAGPSKLIVADIDIVKDEKAWDNYCYFWTSRGLTVPVPQVRSARGGYHVLFAVPEDFDTGNLRQVPLLLNVDIRINNGYVVAAGSYYDGTQKGEASGHYQLIKDAFPPHTDSAWFAALFEVLQKKAVVSKENLPPPSIEEMRERLVLLRDKGLGRREGDKWIADSTILDDMPDGREKEEKREVGFFAQHDQWYKAVFALRRAYGQQGFELAQSISKYREEKLVAVWGQSESTTDNPATIGTLIRASNDLGYRGEKVIREMAAAVGARLSSAGPMPLMDTQYFVAALGQGYLDNFLAGTKDAPGRHGGDHPTLPDNQNTHPLYEQMCAAIERIMTMTDGGAKVFRQDRVFNVLKVLHHMHPPTCISLCQRITSLPGCVITPGKLDSAIKNFEWEVRSEQNTQAGFITDSKGNPAPENSDNVRAFARQRAVALRYNVWREQVEVSDGGDFLQLTDHIFGDLLMDAKNSAFNYHPSESLFRRGMVSIARRNQFDPIVEKLDTLAAAWDGSARLDTWISKCCGTLDDAYHTAVSRNLIGGLVRRARHPGCEQSETVIFISPTQGTGKSTLCKILALDSAWHTDSFKFEGSAQNTIPQLAGKWLIELSELTGLAQKDVEHVKSFLSATSDNFTRKYEAFATDHPRRCCFVGTSNSRRPLQDSSGNRRFLPVQVQGEVNTDWLRANVEQIMGECATREAQGEIFAIPRSVWEAAGKHQEAARAMSATEELCQEWFDRPAAPWGYYITATDIGRALKMAGQSQHARYASFLDKMEWRNENLIVPGTGRKARVWVRHANNQLDQCAHLEPLQRQVNATVEMRLTMPATKGLPTPPY